MTGVQTCALPILGIDRALKTFKLRTYQLSLLRKYLQKKHKVSDIPLSQLDKAFIEGFEYYLTIDRKLKRSSVSSALSTLKTIVRMAVKFQGQYLQPFHISHRKAVYVSEETQRRLGYVVRKIGEQGASIAGYVEQVLLEHLDRYKEECGNMAETLNCCVHRTQACAELLYSMNAVTRQGLAISFFILARCVFVTQTAVCPTKTLAPEWGLNHSEVVIRN